MMHVIVLVNSFLLTLFIIANHSSVHATATRQWIEYEWVMADRWDAWEGRMAELPASLNIEDRR
jgi:hypothetical protein